MLERLDALLSRPVTLPNNDAEAILRLAVFYYWTKAARTSRAAVRLADADDLAEALLLLRGLYNIVVDCLWMCSDPIARSRRFYDATAVGLERQRASLAASGAAFDSDTAAAIAQNRAHFERASPQFTNKKGKVLTEWGSGSLRDRARDVARADPELDGLDTLYDMLYGALSEYEHSAPFLCFQFVRINDRLLSRAPNPSSISKIQFGTALGLLLGALVKKTMHHLDLTPNDFARR